MKKVADSFGVINEGKLIDEFTAEDLRIRTGRFVQIRTNNNAAALEALSGLGISGTVEEGDLIRVNDHLDETEAMAAVIVGAGIGLKEICLNNASLEDYYLKLVGGAQV